MAARIIDLTRTSDERTARREQPSRPTGEHDAPSRQYWRAIVRTGNRYAANREGDRVEWHMAGCDAPHAGGAHCPTGTDLVGLVGHPDGHCVVNGACVRCGPTEVRQAA